MSLATEAAPKRGRNSRLPVPPKDALALRVDDACALIGIGRSTLYRLIERGELKLTRIAGRSLVPRVELERLVAAGLNESGEAA